MTVNTEDTDVYGLMEAAAKQVDRLERAVRRYRIFTILLAAVLVIGGAGTAISLYQVRVDTRNLCVAGNNFRQGDDAIWHELITIALRGNKSPASVTAGHELQAFADQVNAQHRC